MEAYATDRIGRWPPNKQRLRDLALVYEGAVFALRLSYMRVSWFCVAFVFGLAACASETDLGLHEDKSPEGPPLVQLAAFDAQSAEQECTTEPSDWVVAAADARHSCLRLSAEANDGLHLVAIPRMEFPDTEPLLVASNEVAGQQSALAFAVPAGLAAYESLMLLGSAVIAAVAVRLSVDTAQLKSRTFHDALATPMSDAVDDDDDDDDDDDEDFAEMVRQQLREASYSMAETDDDLDPCASFSGAGVLFSRPPSAPNEAGLRTHFIDVCYERGIGFTQGQQFVVAPRMVELGPTDFVQIYFGSKNASEALKIEPDVEGQTFVLPSHRRVNMIVGHRNNALRLSVLTAPEAQQSVQLIRLPAP